MTISRRVLAGLFVVLAGVLGVVVSGGPVSLALTVLAAGLVTIAVVVYLRHGRSRSGAGP